MAVQSQHEIDSLLQRLKGREIEAFQVLGINSLKSVSPQPDALVGEVIEETEPNNRLFTLKTTSHEVVFDLQRAGRLVWLEKAEPYTVASQSSRPTVRLIFTDGQGLDLTEPARTKRITISVAMR